MSVPIVPHGARAEGRPWPESPERRSAASSAPSSRAGVRPPVAGGISACAPGGCQGLASESRIDADAQAALVYEGVRFTYDGAAFALDGVDLEVPRGQFLCILGGNGSGKSTLAKHANALLMPDEGIVFTFGIDTCESERVYEIRSSAALVFQNPDDQIVASLVENDVAFGPENLGIPNPELRARVTGALKSVGLSGFEKRETASLSGGQKQRVALAGVLAQHPALLVLDEATAMLDPHGRANLIGICRTLHAQGMTVVMITHFMEEAACAERVAVMDAGRVVLDGAPDDVLARADELARLHLDVPAACALSCALRRRGVPVSVHVDGETLKEELCGLFSRT